MREPTVAAVQPPSPAPGGGAGGKYRDTGFISDSRIDISSLSLEERQRMEEINMPSLSLRSFGEADGVSPASGNSPASPVGLRARLAHWSKGGEGGAETVRPMRPELLLEGTTCNMLDPSELVCAPPGEDMDTGYLVQRGEWTGGEVVTVASRPIESKEDAMLAMRDVAAMQRATKSAYGAGFITFMGYALVSAEAAPPGARAGGAAGDGAMGGGGGLPSEAELSVWAAQVSPIAGQGPWRWQHVMPRQTGELWADLPDAMGETPRGEGGGMMERLKAKLTPGGDRVASRRRRYGIVIVWEACQGGRLDTFLQSPDANGVGLRVRTKWLLQLAEALSTLHGGSHPSVHMAVSPASVLLHNEEGEGGELGAKLGNLQYSVELTKGRRQSEGKLSPDKLETVRYRHWLVGRGGRRYAAPELLEGAGERLAFERSADVYSFGVLAFHVITGSEPWPGLTDAQVGFQVAAGDRRPEWPAEAVEAIPEGLRECVEQCWSWEPVARPDMASVEEIIRDTLEWL